MILVPTPIDNLNRVDFVGSAKHINITHTSSFDKATIKLWVWSGALDTPYVTDSAPTTILAKSKVSITDTYITFEIGDYISPHINPTVLFDSSITSSTEGVFYQYQVEIEYLGVVVATQTIKTRYATLGYNWDYEGEDTFTYNRGSYGFVTTNINKYYSPYINYSKGTINLSGSTNTSTMVTREIDIPDPSFVRCSKEPYLIRYLNKQGLWDDFTPAGKVIVPNKISRESYTKSFRNPLNINVETDHQTVDFNINSKQSYIINTGSLKEDMGMLVEEILYSPKVYLIQFKGDIATLEGFTPITVDTTLYSVDTTLISADSSVSGIGEYLNYRQIPVTVTDTDFTRKTRISDKNKIGYNIKFEEGSDKINNKR